MSPASQRYNGKIATSTANGGAVRKTTTVAAAATTKILKLQKNTLGRGRLSSLAASPLTSQVSSNSSLVFEENEVKSASTLQKPAPLLATTAKTGRRNKFNTAATESVNEIANSAMPKDSCRNINNNNKNNTTVSSFSSSFKIMSYRQSIFALLAVLLCGLVGVDGLKCQMCGQYNEGVGSITPCLNYSEQNAHLYLKECSKKSEKYCVKYVSELSIVRDCATECSEKEIWETQTYCCTEDGCNGASNMEFSTLVLMVPIVTYICQAIWNVLKEQKRRR
ncbi:uncharacterized protein [Musca autumnalis]|uniref:uncharacterized protein n=1 Tax=Musca autumnalis TaxID=221902 RepID=UPI003CF5F108